jgi:(p)ppGpp synthase/HD superfamily hydrolase
VLQRLKVDDVTEEPVVTAKPAARKRIVTGTSLGVVVPGVEDVLVRLAKCCTPFRATRSRATSPSVAGSRSTAPIART